MREFFELINEYPWTTFLLVLAMCAILNSVFSNLRPPKGNNTVKS